MVKRRVRVGGPAQQASGLPLALPGSGPLQDRCLTE